MRRLAPIVVVAALASAVVACGPFTDDSEREVTTPRAPFHIVALGDSYISGEGAPRFFDGTDRPGSNECRRASTAYPHLVAKQLHASVTSIACSGARTQHVTGVDASGRPVPGQQPDSPARIFGARPQLAELRAMQAPDAVLLSVGGNDAGFAEIGVGCAVPTARDCRRSADGWIRRLDRDVYPALVRTFRMVRAAAGDAPVFAVTYPNPLGPKWCDDVWLNHAEMAFVRDVFIPRLNTLIETATKAAGIRVIRLDHTLDKHRFCEVKLSRAAMNFVTLGRSRGSRFHIRHIKSLIHGSLHPNPLGHELIAKVVTPRLRDARDGRLEPLPPGEPQELPPPPFVPDELRSPAAPRPFPSDTQCAGDKIAAVSPVSVAAGTSSIPLRGAKPRSVVCFRSYRDEWHARRVDADGNVSVPVSVEFDGIGSINEILIQRPNRVWEELIVSRMGP